ncbi:MAG: hypothetical protein HQK50_19265 [Oligoflexia bacterium]|nr:hypothetical protein [Oligoflexia bacterium]MBF0367717.1 hypothetical protein [Oligoflexia bacterium]
MKHYTHFKLPSSYIVATVILGVLSFIFSEVVKTPSYVSISIPILFALSLLSCVFISMISYTFKDVPRRERAIDGIVVEAEVVESYSIRSYIVIKAKCIINNETIMFTDRYSTPCEFEEKRETLLAFSKPRFKPGQKIKLKYKQEDLKTFTFIA